jgi:hypothetical protein
MQYLLKREWLKEGPILSVILKEYLQNRRSRVFLGKDKYLQAKMTFAS